MRSKVAGQLYKRGVKIAFASYDAHAVRNLPYAAGYATALSRSRVARSIGQVAHGVSVIQSEGDFGSALLQLRPATYTRHRNVRSS